MKTIEERAEESANRATIHLLSDSWYIHRNGYIKGATEQRALMIEKFKQWLLDNSQITGPEENRGMLADLLKRMEE